MQCELRKAKYLEIDRLVRTGPLLFLYLLDILQTPVNLLDFIYLAI